MRQALLPLCLALSLAAPQIAAAAQTGLPPGVHSVKVVVSDLDLETKDGARAMLRRLRLATVDVCGSAAGDSSQEVLRVEACYRDTLERSVRQLDRHMVTLAYEKHASDRFYARR